LKLEDSFYQRTKVDKIARDLLGKVLATRNNNSLARGMIVETEAYSYKERGCHAFNNLFTNRTEIMFRPGGCAYVYLCYGVHHLFNVVTNKKDKAEAVLIRALQPLEGQPGMMRRSGAGTIHKITSGPGKLTKAMGIDRRRNGQELSGDDIYIEDVGTKIVLKQIVATKRIGIDYAGEDANLPWRFYIKDNKWISRP